MAVELLPYDAPREVWLGERTKGIGGSDIAAILGMSRWASPRDVWLDKTGRSKPKTVTWAMRRGTALELPLLQWFSEQTGMEWERVGLLAHEDQPWMRVSLDAYVRPHAVAECKTTTWRLADEWDGDQVADGAELQSQWGLAVTGRDTAHVIAAVGENDPVIRSLKRDQGLIDMMAERAARFWHDHIVADKEPPMTAVDLDTVRREYPTVERVSTIGDPELRPAFERREAALAALKFHQAARDQAEAEIVAALADADQLVIDGQVWATRHQQTSRVLSTDLLIAAGLDPDDYKTERVSRVLRVPAPAKRKAVA